jgi:hypothetical protein
MLNYIRNVMIHANIFFYVMGPAKLFVICNNVNPYQENSEFCQQREDSYKKGHSLIPTAHNSVFLAAKLS